jgi:hypothetical protein
MGAYRAISAKCVFQTAFGRFKRQARDKEVAPRVNRVATNHTERNGCTIRF